MKKKKSKIIQHKKKKIRAFKYCTHNIRKFEGVYRGKFDRKSPDKNNPRLAKVRPNRAYTRAIRKYMKMMEVPYMKALLKVRPPGSRKPGIVSGESGGK